MSKEVAFSETTEFFYRNARHYREGEGGVQVKFSVFLAWR
jgi:hypothetical protein